LANPYVQQPFIAQQMTPLVEYGQQYGNGFGQILYDPRLYDAPRVEQQQLDVPTALYQQAQVPRKASNAATPDGNASDQPLQRISSNKRSAKAPPRHHRRGRELVSIKALVRSQELVATIASSGGSNARERASEGEACDSCIHLARECVITSAQLAARKPPPSPTSMPTSTLTNHRMQPPGPQCFDRQTPGRRGTVLRLLERPKSRLRECPTGIPHQHSSKMNRFARMEATSPIPSTSSMFHRVWRGQAQSADTMSIVGTLRRVPYDRHMDYHSCVCRSDGCGKESCADSGSCGRGVGGSLWESSIHA